MDRTEYGNMILDDSIKNFRRFINDEKNINYIIKKYKTDSESDKWNCICSCMNWIDVSRDYLNAFKHETATTEEEFNKVCMNMYLYISAIDVIAESITQLNRVFQGDKLIALKGDKKVFEGILKMDDNTYFKELRSVFGAHPVNLGSKGDRWYASWPSKGSRLSEDNYDFCCYLYSSKKVADDELDFKEIGFRIDDLNQFLQYRYDYLNKFMRIIEKERNKHIKTIIQSELILTDDNVDNVKNLKERSSNLWENTDYENILDDLEMMFVAYKELGEPEEFKEYIEQLKKIIEEIFLNLRKGKFLELKYKNIIASKVDLKKLDENNDFPKDKYHYYIGKLLEHIGCGTYDNYEIEYITAMNIYFEKYIKLDVNESKEKWLLKLNFAMFETREIK